MDINLIRSLVTLVAFAVFLGIVWWAYGARQKERFEQAAQLPFDDESDNTGARR